MDDIKSKLLDFINIQGQPKIPIIGQLEENIVTDEVNKELETEAVNEPERPSDQEILESIDAAFYSSECDFDACRYELNKHSSLVDVSKIQTELKQLKQQHLVVSNHVLQMILEKQSACQEEFMRIVEVQENLQNLLKQIREGRKDLGIATRHFTTASLGILANYRKRTIVLQLLRSLNTIRTLHNTESRMPKLLRAGDFPGAITLLLECLSVAAMYKHFTCIAGLTGKLQDTLEMTEEHLDVALAKICYGFDETIYKKLQSAYFVLGKTQIAMDQLHMHFTSAIHSTASKVVASFINHEDSPSKASSQSNHNIENENYLSNIEFSALCKEVSADNFIPCLLKLCKSLWCIILSYNHVVTWHQNNPINNGGSHFEVCFNEQTMKQKLNSGLNRLWHDIQTRVSSLVLAGNLANYKFDDFLQILAILHRLSQIGEELCGSGSEEVASSIRTQCSNYFKRYHASKLDDLKVFLEYESWTPCPVRSDFSVLYLQEFRGLRCSLEQCAGMDSSRQNLSIDSSSIDANFFARYPDPSKATPFDISFQTDIDNEELLASIPEDPSGDFSEESEDDDQDFNPGSSEAGKGGRSKLSSDRKDGPLLTNTTLSVLRLCGKYLQMSKYLKPIASQVVAALTQLFDYYFYTVHCFFTSDMPNTLSLKVSSLKLQAVLKRIHENIISDSDECEEDEEKVPEAQISSLVDLTSPNTLYGLMERVVGVESLLFLSKEFTFLKPYLEQLLQSQGSTLHHLQQFYSQTICVSFELRKPVYACVAWRAVDEKYTLKIMSTVDWEVKEVMSQHSKYVDFLVSELQQFAKRLSKLQSIPEEGYNIVWDNLIFLIVNIFVEGFSYSKKCSHAGRALMQLDFTQLVSKLENTCTLRPIPYREFVENYIKAYYLVEDQLDSWIKEHREYTSKQLLALVSCVCSNNKKSRQRLSALIDELEESGAR